MQTNMIVKTDATLMLEYDKKLLWQQKKSL